MRAAADTSRNPFGRSVVSVRSVHPPIGTYRGRVRGG
jgi:hypothetical protein